MAALEMAALEMAALEMAALEMAVVEDEQTMIEESPIPWQELFETLFRRRWLIAGGVVVGFLAGFAINVLTPPLYQAKARILLAAQAMSGPREDAMDERQIQAEMALLRSPALVRGVLEEYFPLGAREPVSPGFGEIRAGVMGWLRGLTSKVQSGSPTPELGREVQRVSKAIGVRSIAETNVVEVAYTSHDPEWAATFVNDLIAHHVARIARSNEPVTAGTFFQEQRNLLGVRWEKAREALAAFREKHGTTLLAGDERHLQSVLSQLESDRVTAGTEVLELEARVEFLTQEIESQPATIDAESRVTANEAVSHLQSRILDLEMERSDLLSRYTPTSTAVRNIERQIEEAKALLESKAGDTLSETMTAINPARQTLEVDLVQTRGRLVGARARRVALEEQIQIYRQQLSRLEGFSSELERLKNDVESSKEAYQTYLQKEEEARLTTSLHESGIVNVSIFEEAAVPVTSEPSKKDMVLIAGFAAGLLIGLALAFARDALEAEVRSSAQAWRLTQVPIIAEIAER